ncbi:MAG: hypothetical protein JOZ18_00705 [Chloroflexi bacterium]|nr:hypothetical protein [Chloroflexota bacterium]
MFRQMRKRTLPEYLRLPALILLVVMITLLLSIGIWPTQHKIPQGKPIGHPGPVNPSPVATSGTNNGSVSPLIFGTNLSLFNSSDQVLNSANIRAQLQQMHFRIIRMPIRASLSNQTEIEAAQAIKSMGAYDLVILRGAVDSNVLADDIRVVNDMNSVFGSTVVYYEYGNEEDLQGINAARYTDSWNTVIPQLKRIALRGQFIGPVNYHYDRAYLSTFLQRANPRPDEVSWHEYTCDDSWPSETCISRIDDWTNHISDAREAMDADIGTTLPIMITEWNYAPDANAGDGKINNSSFMTTWTTKALETLAANRVFASMQYACTDSVYALVRGDGTPTAQGLAMQALYQRMFNSDQQPTPVATSAPGQLQPTPTASATTTVAPNQYVAFSFEDGGIDGWSGYGQEVTLEQNSTDNALDGTHALRVTLTNLIGHNSPYLLSPDLTSYPRAGQTIDVYIYLPSDSVTLVAKAFVVDSYSHWLSNNMTNLIPGVWNHLTYKLPASLNGHIQQLGIQFAAQAGTSMSSDVYIDAVGWN